MPPAPGGCLLQFCLKELRVVPLHLLDFTLPAEKIVKVIIHPRDARSAVDLEVFIYARITL